nr:type VI secretion system protein TssA [Pollutimonas harenae]
MGSVPVSASQPAGMNPRDGESFDKLQSQLDRLTDLHAGQGIEWAVVARLSATVLQNEGKDLAVATWLATALFYQHGLSGLADGVHILRDLVETYWEDMSPPASRLRGRRNQMQWLLDQLTSALDEQAIMQMSAMPSEQHIQMLEDWDALDAAWQSRDEEAPAFYGLSAIMRRLPVEQVADSAESAQPTAPVESQLASTSSNAPVASSTAMPALQAAAVKMPDNGADTASAVEHALGSLHPLVSWLMQERVTAPMLFRLNRVCAWTALEQLPPAQGRSTRLPPPPGQLIDTFGQVLKGGEPEAIIRYAEARLASFPYWLDLSRASHMALTQLKASQAAESLALETTHFMARLPGLTELTFSDGQAFADPTTQAWLDALQASGDSGSTTSERDAITALAHEAEGQAVAGKLEDALSQLQVAVRAAESRRASFRLRLAQCHLIHRFDVKTDMRAVIAPLIEELDIHHLSTWEPDLARQALELAAGIELRRRTDGAAPAVPMLGRLSRVDVQAAWQLSQSTVD